MKEKLFYGGKRKMNTSQRIKRVNWVFAATVGISIITSFIPISTFVHNSAVLLLISQLILVFPAIIYIVTEKVPYQEAVRFRRIRPTNIFLLILFTILIMPLMSLVNAISMLFVENKITNTMTNITEQNSFVIALMITALIPCIFEESVYRGVLYNEYRKMKPVSAIFLSAFLFGILHGNLNQFSYAFVMGIVFALVIEATDSILSTMIIHFLINGSSVLTLAFYPKLLSFLESVYNRAVESNNTNVINMVTEFMGGTDFTMDALMKNSQQALTSMSIGDVLRSYGPMALISTGLALLVYRTIAVNADRWQYIKEMIHAEKKEQHLITLPLAIAILICIVLMILSELV